MSSSTSASSRAIGRGLLALVAFLLALFLFDRGLSLALREFELRYYGHSDFERRLASYLKDRRFNALVFGTSRAYEGISVPRLDACLGQRFFKETFQGKGPKYNLHFYRLFKKHAGVPRVVVYGVDYFIYSVESDPRWMSRFNRDGRDERFRPLAAPLLLLAQKRRNDLFLNNLVNDLADQASREPPPGDAMFDEINGYTGAQTPADNPRLVTRKPRRFLRQYMPRPPGTEGEYFDRLLAELEADGVRVALVSLPDYVGTYLTNLEVRHFHNQLKAIRRRHRNVVTLLYNNPSRFDMNDGTLFLDGGWGKTNSHLSARGAAALAGKLCQDLAPLFTP